MLLALIFCIAISAVSCGKSPPKCPDPKPDCIPTCVEPNPQNCEYNSKYDCESGFILNKKGGKFIEIGACPQDLGCNGDENAVVMSCPPPCPSTCCSPEESPCKKMCLEVGCACKRGFILTEDGGKCIEPDHCPGGNPCGANETFTSCRIQCPNSNCPLDDFRGVTICDPIEPCPSGCVCKLGYRRTNTDDHECILAEECPPVECTRINEVYNCCPECLAEDCIDKDNQPTTCNPLVHNCDPKCVCDDGFFRNGSDLCVPAAECPVRC